MLIAPHTKKLSLQDCFNAAYLWIHEHDRCKVVHICRYRNEDNTNACLIGCVIPDELYQEKFEGRTITQLIALPEIKNLFTDDISQWIIKLGKLQQIHDNNKFRSEIIAALKDFAQDNNLSLPL